MRTVKIRIGRDHLRFDPDAELHSERIDLVDELLQAAPDLILIDGPVPKSGNIQVTFAEPAVVHDEHLDPAGLRLTGDRQELFIIEIEIRRLPVVDQDRALFVLPDAADQVVPVQVMERMRHAAQAFAGVNHDALRRLETVSGLQDKGKAVGIDPECHAKGIIEIALHLAPEVSGVNKVESIDFPLRLCRGLRHKPHERMLLMRGFPAVGGNALETVPDVTVIHVALTRPRAVERQKTEIPLVHIQGQRHHFFQAHGRPAVIDDTYAPHDGIHIREDRVGQHKADMEDRILHGDLKGHGVIRMAEGRRQPRQPVLPAVDTMRDIVSLHRSMAVCVPDRRSTVPVVPGQLAGKLVAHV